MAGLHITGHWELKVKPGPNLCQKGSNYTMWQRLWLSHCPSVHPSWCPLTREHLKKYFKYMSTLHRHAWYPQSSEDPLKLELETVVSHHIGAENQIQVGPLEEQPVLLNAELSLSSPIFICILCAKTVHSTFKPFSLSFVCSWGWGKSICRCAHLCTYMEDSIFFFIFHFPAYFFEIDLSVNLKLFWLVG